MADNTRLNAGIGGDLYAADELTTVNSLPADAGLKVQRVKVGYGDEGALEDVSIAKGLPVWAQALDLLRRIAQLLKPLQQVTGGGSNRLSVDINNAAGATLGTVTTVTTVTTVSNVATVTTLANVWAFDHAKAMSRQAYNTGIRSRIS